MKMLLYCLVTAVGIVSIPTDVAASGDQLVTLMTNIEQLNSNFKILEAKYDERIQSLEDKFSLREAVYVKRLGQLERRVAKLESKNKIITRENAFYNMLIQTGEEYKDQLPKVKTAVITSKQENSKIVDSDTVETSTPTPLARNSGKAPRQRRALQDEQSVAFSAYQGHTVDGLGHNQTIIFDKIILNEGNSYNIHTGIFTAPLPGIYHFTFFIGERGYQDQRVSLWVNSAHIVDAAIDTRETDQDLQGGNTAIVKLSVGDVVRVKNNQNSHIEGRENFRITTFSGFLLYAMEDSAIIG